MIYIDKDLIGRSVWFKKDEKGMAPGIIVAVTAASSGAIYFTIIADQQFYQRNATDCSIRD